MCQQWWFYCASHWGWETPLSKHVYCVAVTFKMTEQVQQWICIKFCVMLEHSSMETIHMIQKTAATRNWWLAVLSQQCARSCIASRAVFWQNTKSSKWCSPLQPRFGVLWLLAFLKTDITFEREEISESQWDLGRYDGAASGNWENCVRSQGAYSKGYWGHCPMYSVSCILNKCLYFSYYMAGYLLDRPCMCNLFLMPLDLDYYSLLVIISSNLSLPTYPFYSFAFQYNIYN